MSDERKDSSAKHTIKMVLFIGLAVTFQSVLGFLWLQKTKQEAEEQKETEVNSLETQISQMKNSNEELEAELIKSNIRVDELEELVKNLSEQNVSLEKSLTPVTSEKEDMLEELADLRSDYRKIKAKYKDAKIEIEELEAKTIAQEEKIENLYIISHKLKHDVEIAKPVEKKIEAGDSIYFPKDKAN